MMPKKCEKRAIKSCACVPLKQLCHDLGPDRAKHSNNRNQKIRTGKDRTVSDWPESEKEKLESGQRTLEGGKCQH